MVHVQTFNKVEHRFIVPALLNELLNLHEIIHKLLNILMLKPFISGNKRIDKFCLLSRKFQSFPGFLYGAFDFGF